MQSWFIDSSRNTADALVGTYEPVLVVLSIVVVCLASHAALNITGRMVTTEKTKAKIWWLLGGALILGTGGWAMHFIGMLAFQLPVPAKYDPLITFLSTLPSILGCALMLWFISRHAPKKQHLVIGGLFYAASIGAMHYTGMAAIRTSALMLFDPVLVGLSVIVATVLGVACVFLIQFANARGKTSRLSWTTIGLALFMGFTVSGSHYTGQAAAYFFPVGETVSMDAGMNPVVLGGWVGTVSIFVTAFAILMTVVDRRLELAARSERLSGARLLEAIESFSDGFALYDTEDRLVICNKTFRQRMIPARRDKEGLKGMLFEDIIRGVAESGLIHDAGGRIEAFLTARMAHHRNPAGLLVQRWHDAWLQINERRSEGLGTVTVYRDISELKYAEEELKRLSEKLKQENTRMGTELGMLRRMQQMILPKKKELEEIASLDIAGFMQPTEEVGGDYYDILHHDGVVTISIGDITGHGLESGILMVMTQSAVRTLKETREVNLVRFLDVLNRTIYQNIQRMNSEKNLTLAVLNYVAGKLSVCGQHEELIVVRSDGRIERIDTIDLGFPIGLELEIAGFIGQKHVSLNPGDGFVLYTDGITEAENFAGDQYGLDRLCDTISLNWPYSAENIKDAVVSDLRTFIDAQSVYDDLTLVVAKRRMVS
ncbi:MAG: SpoIIE family protein phosphatase [Gammaproteobacteria bacterium]